MNYFLFSVDLEDVRNWMPDGQKYRPRVPEMTEQYLGFLDRHGMKCTFFIVGDVAEAYPELIRKISDAGHEIACHTNKHIPLEKQTPAEFKVDLLENISHLKAAGVDKITGFRAPIFSMTEKTQWAYEVLAELGFEYSSSVLPAKSPLYGWPGFGREFRTVNNRIWEMPITLFPFKTFSAPCAGGLYFRTFPYKMTRWAFRQYENKQQPVLSYFHPYDIDTEQERFMHPGIKGNRFYNAVMYYNRGSVFKKLEKIIDMGWKIVPYRDYLRLFLEKNNHS